MVLWGEVAMKSRINPSIQSFEIWMRFPNEHLLFYDIFQLNSPVADMSTIYKFAKYVLMSANSYSQPISNIEYSVEPISKRFSLPNLCVWLKF